jgi:hypothetical protein
VYFFRCCWIVAHDIRLSHNIDADFERCGNYGRRLSVGPPSLYSRPFPTSRDAGTARLLFCRAGIQSRSVASR